MDVAQKKQEVLESIASQPLNVVYIRVDVCDQVQLADLLKEDFVSYLRGPANSGLRPSDSVQANTDSLHEVCINLAKQRALLQGAAAAENPATGILSFKIDDGTAATRADGTATHNTTGSLSFGKFSNALAKLSLGDKMSLAKFTLPYFIESIFSLFALFLKFSISAKNLNFSSM